MTNKGQRILHKITSLSAKRATSQKFSYELLQNPCLQSLSATDFSAMNSDSFSSSGDSSSSSEHLSAFPVDDELVEGIQGYQFQPRRDFYMSSEEDASGQDAESSTGTNDSFNVRLGNLDG